MQKEYGKIYGKNLCGKLSVSESVSLVHNSDLVISVDSCTAHMAAAFNLPQILIHGTTSLTRWKPKNEKCAVATKKFPCSPCVYQTGAKRLCRGHIPRCMLALTAEDVIMKIEEIKNDLYTKI